ncbi:MAG: hypothetical protein QNJ64_03700 [Crocosphaera sp.]|nr:hypothetical protein [Crocosphaera sp.]
MVEYPSHQKPLNIAIDATNPNCLQGLEQLLQLGLISHQQVREICEIHFCCFLPESAIVSSREDKELVEVTSLSLFNTETILTHVTNPLRKVTGFIAEIGKGLKTELSIRWLLFLGVFLVVASSGLLAATQWKNLSDLVQYTVLWLYTLSFWGLGIWTKQQQHLSLTSKSLRAIAWLLVPINFWGMDSLQLANNWQGLVLRTIAASSLTYIYYHYSKRSGQWLFFINILLINFLHWGWHFPHIPVLTIYLGTLLSVVILRGLRIPKTTTRYTLDLEKGFIIYGLFILLLRGLLHYFIPVSDVSLVIGILGWLLQSKQPASINLMTPILEGFGIILLFCGWLAGIQVNYPWQASIVSLLAIHFFTQRLRRDWQRRNVFAIFIIGLQTLFLWEELLPVFTRRDILIWGANISNTVNFAFTFYSILLFPYVVFFVIFTQWIYRKNKIKVGQFGDYLIFIMTIGLSLIAVVNPLWRSLDLLLSTVTFIYLSHRPTPLKNILINLTSITGILGILSLIHWFFPNRTLLYWSQICLILMFFVWILGNLPLEFIRVYHNSCRYLGFILAGCSYIFLWPTLETYFNTRIPQPTILSWFIVPLALTGVAIVNYKQLKKRRRAAFISTYCLILAQPLTLGQPQIRLIGLAIGSALMLLNSYFFRHPFAARIQVGFTVFMSLILLWENFDGNWLDFLDSSDTLLDNRLLLIFFCILSLWLQRFHHPLAVIYRKATHGWSIIIALILLIRSSIVTYFILFNNQAKIGATWQYLIVPFLLITIIIIRYRINLNKWAIYGITWALEISIIYCILPFTDSTLIISITNLVAAVPIFFLIRFLNYKYTQLSQIISFQLVPVYFAILAILWRFNSFNAYTGLITIIAALIGIIVTYPLFIRKIYTYIFLGLITVGIDEFFIYRMTEGMGTNLPNRLLLMGLVTAIISVIYLFLEFFLISKNRSYLVNLSLIEFAKIAHVHWAIASILKTIGVASAALIFRLNNTSPYLNPLTVSVSLLLSFYAFIQGRSPIQSINNDQSNTFKKIWIYVGFIDIASTLIFYRLIWENLSFLDSYYAGIFGIIALIIYNIPWINFGWNAKPWQEISLLLPTVLASVTTRIISYESLLLVALFYGQVAINKKNLRWTYLSLVFINWAIINFLIEIQWLNQLTISLIIGLFILHIAQFDPFFRQGSHSNLRYYLRLLGIGVINITGLIYYQIIGTVPILISLITIGWGLGLKIKAFLYVGTSTFIITIVYQLILLSFEYAPLKWILGLTLGMILIMIAAMVEKRRQKIPSILQNWIEVFRQWK